MGKWSKYLIFLVIAGATLAVHFGYIPDELFLLVLGLVITIIGMRTLITNRNIIKNGGCENATVVKTVRERSPSVHQPSDSFFSIGWSSMWYTYIPILQYEVNGRTYEVRYHGNAKPKYKDGEIVRIKYDKGNVEKVTIVGDNTTYIVSVVAFFSRADNAWWWYIYAPLSISTFCTTTPARLYTSLAGVVALPYTTTARAKWAGRWKFGVSVGMGQKAA